MSLDGISLYNQVIENICHELSQPLARVQDSYKGKIEEIRLRSGMPLNLYFQGQNYFVSPQGELGRDLKDSVYVSPASIHKTFQLISNYSVYAFQEEIKNGFITLRGGHRVGIGGKVLYGSRGIETIKNISSLNIRIAREKKDIAQKLVPYILDYNGSIYNTLIISPPQCGKTTLLRDLIRILSNGPGSNQAKGFKLGVIDERSEISGMYNGQPQHDIGIRTDVLDGCNKKDGTTMLIRAMSPDIIAMDEIGSHTDVEAIHESLKAGIKIIATVHGSSLKDLLARRSLKILLEDKVFGRYVSLDNSRGVGTIRQILDGESFNPINK